MVRRIDLRLVALKRFDQRIERCRYLTDAHQATLAGYVDNVTTGLTALRTKVQAEITIPAIRTDAQSMAGLQAYILRGPQVHGTCTADNETAAACDCGGRREAGGRRSQGQTGRCRHQRRRGRPTRPWIASLDTVEALLSGQVDKLLAIQPGLDGDAIRGQIRGIRQQLRTAAQALRRAVVEAKQVGKSSRARLVGMRMGAPGGAPICIGGFRSPAARRLRRDGRRPGRTRTAPTGSQWPAVAGPLRTPRSGASGLVEAHDVPERSTPYSGSTTTNAPDCVLTAVTVPGPASLVALRHPAAVRPARSRVTGLGAIGSPAYAATPRS